MNKVENAIGLLVVLAILVFGESLVGNQMHFFRLVVGLGFGYALSRAFMGFAGSVNRPYRTGSTKLLKVLMWMFLATTVITTALMFKDPAACKLWIRPINTGMVLGGLLFGFGMTFSSCCATGVLTDLVSGFSRALVVILFFGIGVLVGMPIAKTKVSWVVDSVVKIGGKNGIYMPDLFKWDGLNGYLGATVLTAIFAGIVVYLSKKFEESKKKNGSFSGVASEIEQYKPVEEPKEFKLLSENTYNMMFVKPWTMGTGALVIVALFALLMGVTGSGWGASTIHGLWTGKLLNIFGVPAASLAAYTHFPAKFFSGSFLLHPVAAQNFGIILGTIVYLLSAGLFKKTVTAGMKIKLTEVLLFALGGFCMGFGTRLSNGCNVGALYTPIANFSLSGWLFLAFLIGGGILGNKIAKMTKRSCVS